MNLVIQPLPARFDLTTAVCSYGYYVLAPNHWDKAKRTLHHPFRGARGRLIATKVSQNDGVLRVRSSASVSAAERQTVRRQLSRMLRLDEDLGPWFKLHAAARRKGFGRLYRSATLFEDIVKTITACNVGWAQTVRMNQLLVDHFGRGGFPTPAQLAAVPAEDVKQVCRVGYRAERIVRLARDVESGKLDLNTFEDATRDTVEVYRDLRAIYGIGDYAANNLLQLVGRYDRLAIDSETYRHFREVHDTPTPKTASGLRRLHRRIERHYDRFAPYQYLAYWFELWHRYAFAA